MSVAENMALNTCDLVAPRPMTRMRKSYGACRRLAGRSSCKPPRSDPQSHPNDGLSDRAQAGVVVAGVPAHELVGVIDRDRFVLRRDPLCLFDKNPCGQPFL